VLPTTITVRPYVSGQDDALWIDIHNRATDEYPEAAPLTLSDFELQRRGPWFDAAGMLIAELDAVPAGCADAWVDRRAAEEHGELQGPFVLPERRRLGVGTALAKAAFADLRSRGKTRVQLWHRDSPASVAFAESLEFRCVRVFHSLTHNMTSIPRSVGENREITLVELPADDATIELENRLMNESFREHFSYRALTLDETRHLYRTARERNEWLFTLVARLEGEPVGFLLGGSDPAVVERRGTSVGRLHVLGVLKPFRNRGIAKALLIAGMERLQERGMTEAELRVDSENANGALQLYELLGFRAAGRRLTQVRDLT
jgi:mycothiol synthase